MSACASRCKWGLGDEGCCLLRIHIPNGFEEGVGWKATCCIAGDLHVRAVEVGELWWEWRLFVDTLLKKIKLVGAISLQPNTRRRSIVVNNTPPFLILLLYHDYNLFHESRSSTMKRGIVTFGCVWFSVRCANFFTSTFPLNCARSIKIDTNRSFKTQQGPPRKKHASPQNMNMKPPCT